MPAQRALALAAAVAFLPRAFAHGDDAHEMGGMDMHDAPAPAEAQPASDWPMTYFSFNEHVGLLYAYVALCFLTWVVLCPIAVMLSSARSRFNLPAQVVFLASQGFALFLGVVYNAKTPDLYPANAHNRLRWVLMWISVVWFALGLVNLYTGRTGKQDSASEPLSAAVMARYQRLQQVHQPATRWSNDSGQGTERNSASLFSHSRSPSNESDNNHFEEAHAATFHNVDDDEDVEDVEKRGFLRDTRVDRFLSRNVPRLAVGKTLSVMNFFYVVIERTILILGFVSLSTGACAMGGIARGDHIFNILAHFVKGAIFFWYGLLTLGRWMGCFAEFGWAWNVKPTADTVGRWKAAIPTAEFTESLVIFTYGASNVFLEHLAAWGGEWVAQDLEHVSISVMFFGGGALGMLIESKRVRELLNTSILGTRDHIAHAGDEHWEEPATYRFSYNPMPGLVIILLGMMMGSHHQASMLSSMIHMQWGNMFVGFGIARAATYIILYLKPPTSYLPSRPITELISAFCLVAGGLTFMVSNKDTVSALESYDLDAMFTFVITIGLTCLILTWTVVMLAFRGWALRRESAGSGSAGSNLKHGSVAAAAAAAALP
ncbi:uncharacterized protein K452DRAFT_295918 [Aplosporella prunicola CBS 121167]|uniref:Protein YTP1-like C-terminal domain-containing protein n=1 Tax=Aplosporella prunicola CBS 121167 TaxID=1176127 RepID=A0A6A6BKB3_9PEZI|nr:uncharacterized protein K452DRAFT_295918 [Aplosporella prunicola CBS 121167]KAF2144476.1 hypothetical protein K452DRAFT_295918 [Aplosporella prunicola CBS 121167]